MIFRTEIDIKPSKVEVNYDSKLFFVGSCFAENIEKRLRRLHFNTTVNPLGVLYNPLSIAASLQRFNDVKLFEESDIELDSISGDYFTFDAYTLLNNSDKSSLLDGLNSIVVDSHNRLESCDILVITLGTSWIYRDVRSHQVVANCQKQPSSRFIRERLSVESIVASFTELLSAECYKNKQIIFTVSPIRHLKDGLQENSLSKSTLICAAHQLVEQFENVSYFPSYEILMDDLRDYRFYESDMVHPSKVAVDYIWISFLTSFLSKKSQEIVKKMDKIVKALEHRPIDPNSQRSKEHFLENEKKLEELKKKLNLK